MQYCNPKVDKKGPYYHGNKAEYACCRIIHTPNRNRDPLDEGGKNHLYDGSEEKHPTEPVENQGGGLVNVPCRGDQGQAEHGGKNTYDA